MKNNETIKLSRIRKYLYENNFSSMVLARADNFNWISSGGNNRVIISNTEGVGVIVVTASNVYLVAQVMDGSRIMDEEMANLTAEYVPLKWFEQSVVDKAICLAGDNPVSDIYIEGSSYKLTDIYDLHFPLTENEIEQLTTFGAIADEIITNVAKQVKRGMIDYEIEALLQYEYAKRNIACDVLLIGTDDRIFKYKHPNPIGARVDKYLFLHPALRMGGLHCNITRSIYFGDTLPNDIDYAYKAASEIQAYCMAQCAKHATWNEILAGQEKFLSQYGFPLCWDHHYPGGRTGYFVCQANLALNPLKRTQQNEPYDWFITVNGAKVEELSINHNGEFKILSQNGHWPSKKMEIGALKLDIPQIMML